jgi:hypothetical protein
LVFFFDGTRVWTQDFVLAKQVLYHLSHTSSPFCFGYFGDGVLWAICPGWPWTKTFLISASQVARIICVSHGIWLVLFLSLEFLCLGWGCSSVVEHMSSTAKKQERNSSLGEHGPCCFCPYPSFQSSRAMSPKSLPQGYWHNELLCESPECSQERGIVGIMKVRERDWDVVLHSTKWR